MSTSQDGATQALTVGQVADELGVTVRTLHHYDGIGLVTPSGRTRAGYRLYTAADLERLQHVVVYRRLGFSLEEVAELLDADQGDLRAQRAPAAFARFGEDASGLVEAPIVLAEHALGLRPPPNTRERGALLRYAHHDRAILIEALPAALAWRQGEPA